MASLSSEAVAKDPMAAAEAASGRVGAALLAAGKAQASAGNTADAVVALSTGATVWGALGDDAAEADALEALQRAVHSAPVAGDGSADASKDDEVRNRDEAATQVVQGVQASVRRSREEVEGAGEGKGGPAVTSEILGRAEESFAHVGGALVHKAEEKAHIRHHRHAGDGADSTVAEHGDHSGGGGDGDGESDGEADDEARRRAIKAAERVYKVSGAEAPEELARLRSRPPSRSSTPGIASGGKTAERSRPSSARSVGAAARKEVFKKKARARALANLGDSCRALKESGSGMGLEDAKKNYVESAALYHEVDDPGGEAEALTGLAAVARMQGDMAAAAEAESKAMELMAEM